MTCKDCLYEPNCLSHISFGMGKDWNNRYTPDMEKRCESFKNKADVGEVKHGEWLKTEAYPHRVFCSLCYKTYVTNEEAIQGRSWQHPCYCTEAEYCPHCGAKMDKKEGAEK